MLETAKALVEARADVNAVNTDGSTAAIVAAQYRREVLARFLIGECGARVDRAKNDGLRVDKNGNLVGLASPSCRFDWDGPFDSFDRHCASSLSRF